LEKEAFHFDRLWQKILSRMKKGRKRKRGNPVVVRSNPGSGGHNFGVIELKENFGACRTINILQLSNEKRII